MRFGNLIYFARISNIGGIETWLYNISQLFSDLDIVVAYKTASMPQLQRLSKKIRCIYWNGTDPLECERLFCNFNTEIIPFVKAEEKYIVLHGDYEDMVKRGQLWMKNIPLVEGVKYIGITQTVCDAWERLTGIKCTLCFNPVLPAQRNKVIRICSAQRLSREKGRGRIEALARALDNLCSHTGERYIWDIYTNDTNAIYNENIHFLQPRLDVTQLYSGYDWFVALSDNEGYCYSVVEALQRGVPCVVTDIPVFRELNLNSGNSIKMKLDTSDVDFVAFQIMNKKLKFEYEPPKDNWRFLFADIKNTYEYKEVERMLHKVVALDTYSRLKVKDAVLDRILPEGFIFEVDDGRLEVLKGKNGYKAVFVKELEEPEVKEEVTEEVKEVEEVKEEKPKARRKKK